jgi:hypothetical protein
LRKHISRFPNERPGEPLIDLEERQLKKESQKIRDKIILDQKEEIDAFGILLIGIF